MSKPRFTSGQNFATLVKQLSDSSATYKTSDNVITEIQRVYTAPDSSVNTVELSDNLTYYGSIKGWLDGTVLKIYTEFEGSIEITNASNMFDSFKALKKVDLVAIDCCSSYLTDLTRMFYDSSAIEDIDISCLDGQCIQYMSYFCCLCRKLKSVKLPTCIGRTLQTMSAAFSTCDSLVELDLSSITLQRRGVAASYLFHNDSTLRTIYVSETFDNSLLSTVNTMFQGCTSLVGGNGTIFDSSKTDTTYARIDASSTPGYFTKKPDTQGIYCNIFYNVSADEYDFVYSNHSDVQHSGTLYWHSGDMTNTRINQNTYWVLPSMANSKVKTIEFESEIHPRYLDMYFSGLSSVVNVINPNNLKTDLAVSFYSMFIGVNVALFNVNHFDLSSATSIERMFGNGRYDTGADEEQLVLTFNTSNIKSMEYLFYSFGVGDNLELDVSSFNTSNVTDMSSMFEQCGAKRIIGLNNFDTENVTNMRAMFSGGSYYSPLVELDVSSFNTTNVENMNLMFGKSQLTSLNLSNFDTSSVTNMSQMFSNCINLSEIKGLTNFETSQVTTMGNMFYNCPSLLYINLANFNTSSVTEMGSMFWGFMGEQLDLTSFNTSNVNNMSAMFRNCLNLKTIKVSNNFSVANVTSSSNMFTDSTNLVGGNGTTYDANNIDKIYAVIDTTNTPGYFTLATHYPIGIYASLWDTNSTGVGDTLLLGSQPSVIDTFPSDMYPVGYKKLNYVENKGTDYINIGVDADLGKSFEFTIELLEYPIERQVVFGYDFTEGNNIRCFYPLIIDPDGTVGIGFYSNIKMSSNKLELNTKYKISAAIGGVYGDNSSWSITLKVNDVRYVWYSGSWTRASKIFPSDNLVMFGQNSDGVITAHSFKYRIYDLDIRRASYDDITSDIKSFTFYENDNVLIITDDINSVNVDVSITKFNYELNNPVMISNYDNQNDYKRTHSYSSHIYNADKKVIKTCMIIDDINISEGTGMYMFQTFTSMTKLFNTYHLNTSYATSFEYMFSACYSITNIDISHFDTSNATNMRYMFYNCENVLSLDVTRFDTSRVTNIYGMFENCKKLNSLNLSSFIIENVTDIRRMFSGCSSLKELNIINFDTSEILNMERLFYNTSIELDKFTIDYNKFTTNKVTNMSAMFAGSGDRTNNFFFDLTKLNTSNVTDMSSMFQGVKIEGMLDLTSLNTSKVTSMTRMFSNMIGVTSIKGINNLDVSKVENFSNLFEYSRSLLSLDLSNWRPKGPSLSLSYWFNRCEHLKTINLTGWGYLTITSFDSTFSQRTVTGQYSIDHMELEEIIGFGDLHYTGNTMSSAFNGCINIKELIMPYTTNALTSLAFFTNFKNIEKLDCSHMDTSGVSGVVKQLFYNLNKLTEVNIIGWDLSKVTSLDSMFYGCNSLTKIITDASMNVPLLTTVTSMFWGCQSLSNIKISMNAPSLNDTRSMFGYCRNLKTIDISELYAPNITNSTNMFYLNSELETIYSSDNVKFTGTSTSGNMFSSVPKLVGQSGTATAVEKKYTVDYAQIDTWDSKGYFSTKDGITELTAPEVTKITSASPDTNNTITSKIPQIDVSNVLESLESAEKNGLVFDTNQAGVTHISGTSTASFSHAKNTDITLPAGDYVFKVNFSQELAINTSQVILVDVDNNRLAIINLWSTKTVRFSLSEPTTLKYYYFYTNPNVIFDADLSIQLYADDNTNKDYYPHVDNPLFYLYGLQIYDVNDGWTTVYEKHSNAPITDLELLSLIIRNVKNNVSDEDPMVLRYSEGFTNGEKYNYNLEAGQTYRARIVTRIQNATDMVDGISEEFGMWIPSMPIIRAGMGAYGLAYRNGYGYRIKVYQGTNNMDTTVYDVNNIQYNTSVNNTKRNANVSSTTIYFPTFTNDELYKIEFNGRKTATINIFIPFIDNYYSSKVIDDFILESSAFDEHTKVANINESRISVTDGVLSVNNFRVISSWLNTNTARATLEISKNQDFTLLTHQQTIDVNITSSVGPITRYAFDDITLDRSDVGVNYVRIKLSYSNDPNIYSYPDEYSEVQTFEFVLIDPVIDSFDVVLNANNELEATVVETTGVPTSTITLEVYKDIQDAQPYAEIPLTTGVTTLLPYDEPGTSWYFKAKASNIASTVYAQEVDPDTQESYDKVVYKEIPLTYTPDYENVAQPNIVAQKIQLNQTCVLQFNWTNIVTNAYRTVYNVYVIDTDNPLSPVSFANASTGITQQYEDRIDRENVKFMLECQLLTSDNRVLKTFQVESPFVELDAVDLENPSVSFTTDRTYHSITYNLSNMTKNNYKLAYELLYIKDGETIVSQKETGDSTPTTSSPDLQPTTQNTYDNLDANKTYKVGYKYIFVNPLDSSKTVTLSDELDVNTLELLLYAIRNEHVEISNQVANQPTTKSNISINWTAPQEGSEPVAGYIIRYKKSDSELYQTRETSNTNISILAEELGLRNEDIIEISVGAKYTLYDSSQQVVWKDLIDITIAITDYALYRTTYPDTEVMLRTLYRTAESDEAEQLVREIQSL